MNLRDVPFEILGLTGLIVIETRCAVETVKPVDPLTDPNAALIVLLPATTLDTKPCALMVAAAALDDVQMTVVVMSCVLLSLKLPVAVNCFVVPTAMLEFAGVTAMDTKAAEVTITDAVPLIPPEVAVMVAVPGPVVLPNPAGSMLTTELEDEDQARDVSNWVLPSSNVPTAVNC